MFGGPSAAGNRCAAHFAVAWPLPATPAHVRERAGAPSSSVDAMRPVLGSGLQFDQDMLLLLIILLVLALAGGGFGYSRYGYGSWSPAGLVILILIVLALTGNL